MKSNITTIVIALIVVIAIAGTAVYVLNNNAPGGGDDITKGTLPVFGNANDDDVIDAKDIELLNKMIAESIPISDYPFSDANRDGVINDADIAIVNKIVAGEETEVIFVDQFDLIKSNFHYVTIDYPLKDVVTQNADMLLMTVLIDADDQVAGFVANIENYPNEFYKVTHNGVSKQVGSTARFISAADWEGIKNLDVELHQKGSKIGAIIVHSEAALGDYKDDIEAAGIPIIYLRCTDPVYSIDAGALLGFLMGPDHAKKANEFSKDCRQTISKVQEIVSNIPDKDKKHFISLCMKIYVAENKSQYTNIGLQAGGVEESGLEGTSSAKLQDTEAITKYNNKIDYMLNCSTQDCVWIEPADLWELGDMRYLEKSTHFHDMVWINMSMPVPCRVMYAVSIFYPDIVSRAEADDYLQKTVDKYMSYLDNTVSDGDFDVKTDMFTIITYQDYLDSKDDPKPGEKVVSDINALLVAEHFLNLMDLSDYQGIPYTASGDDQEAHVYPTSGKYFLDVKLFNNPKFHYDTKKAEYEDKIGKQSSMGGTYLRIEVDTGLTEGIGYYVNTENKDSIGSMYYTGYYKECFIEIHLAKKPALSQEDLENIVNALWGIDSDISALEAANRFDKTLLDDMDYPPYTVTTDSDAQFAKIACKENSAGKDYYITYDCRSDALVNYMTERQEYVDKIGKDYMGGIAIAVEKNELDDGYGFYAQAIRQGGFWMFKYVGVMDGCYITVYLRDSDSPFDADRTAEIVNAIAASIAVS
jgi:hypothetical protein